MDNDTTPSDREELLALLDRIRAAWTEGPIEILDEVFHERMVIAGPGMVPLGEGREACVRSYRDFLARARVRAYEQFDPVASVFGDTAVASYRYVIAFELEGRLFREKGRDLFVFAREEGRWRAVWRTLLPEPETERAAAPRKEADRET
ncbi:MAG: nuclear transport factor 2 family protein [Candidatus Eisenbacteria bacterium]|nr:nuclear transport factor 2 family protein [Candidatus Eisenbacteria bacterium]